MGEAVEGRKIYLLGGDVHLGGFSQIKCDDKFMFEQMIASPVCNNTIGKVAFAVTNAIKDSGKKLDERWSFEHYGWSNQSNIGLIQTAPDNEDLLGNEPKYYS